MYSAPQGHMAYKTARSLLPKLGPSVFQSEREAAGYQKESWGVSSERPPRRVAGPPAHRREAEGQALSPGGSPSDSGPRAPSPPAGT